MPSETPRLDELLKDSPYFTTFSREMFAAARAELAALREQLKQARKYLLRYGRHDDGSIDDMENCKSHECGPDTCDCGLDAAILALKGS